MKKSSTKLKRRDFIRKTSIGLGGMALAPSLLSSYTKTAANDQIMIGSIGLGQRGTTELKNYLLPLEGSRITAVCDVHKYRRDESVNTVTGYYSENKIKAPKCKAYLDYEEILARNDIDAVHITTPDHWHVLMAINAARAGKHIMLAKPLGLSYPHYMILKEELKKNNVRFHYATQQRTMEHLKLGISMVREGKIGEIERVDVWAPGKNDVESPLCIDAPVPEGFDFDRWTGPAALNSYCPDRVTNNSSWFQYDYSIGFLAGWGAHPLDVLVWGVPDKISGTYTAEGKGLFWPKGGIYDNIFSWDVRYSYESGMKVHFMSRDKAGNGMLNHRTVKDGNGTTFYGTKGWISLSRKSAESNIPELNRKLNDFPRNDNGGMKSDPHTMGKVFLDVIHGRYKETCPLDDAIISDTISHMGDIAIRANHPITWDPVKGEVVDNPSANALYVREMRPPYTI
ncbi:MAG: Gfo/Idh/MocA family oxidoreductase [Maribacter sp.]|nr:Gfo/Idh/MocA family oxidoreductase [Maribacter sp.]